MQNGHTYRVVAWWSSGRTGLAKSDSAPNAVHFTAPPEFGGLEGRWTPEDLLLCALSSCYTTTFRALAEYSKLDYADLEVEVEGTIRKAESGYAFQVIYLRPKVTISRVEDEGRAQRLLEKTKSLCLVSRAVSVQQIMEPQVQVLTPHTEFVHTAPAG